MKQKHVAHTRKKKPPKLIDTFLRKHTFELTRQRL